MCENGLEHAKADSAAPLAIYAAVWHLSKAVCRAGLQQRKDTAAVTPILVRWPGSVGRTNTAACRPQAKSSSRYDLGFTTCSTHTQQRLAAFLCSSKCMATCKHTAETGWQAPGTANAAALPAVIAPHPQRPPSPAAFFSPLSRRGRAPPPPARAPGLSTARARCQSAGCGRGADSGHSSRAMIRGKGTWHTHSPVTATSQSRLLRLNPAPPVFGPERLEVYREADFAAAVHLGRLALQLRDLNLGRGGGVGGGDVKLMGRGAAKRGWAVGQAGRG